MAFRILAAAALLASGAVAKTDIGGCTSFDSVYTPSHGSPYATRIWYVPDTGEVCEILDCGGGRAPPKTTVPGCAAYKGTETYSPKFINPATLGKAPQAASTTLVVSASTTSGSSSGAATTAASSSAEAASSSGSSRQTTSVATLPTLTSASGSASVTTPASSDSESSSDESASGSSTGSSTGSQTGSSSAAASSSVPGAAAAPTAAIMGSCLLAGAAACLAML
ncbi:unnamed protein product [Clonostachys rosea]|uniref:Siderophore biosynthesis enzyme n=1 Tax=Bionectria ochroleuca TaxID=29856 RepID=A0ABY6UB34_BIOOC|nr:unnamed protein product [Clonostachys rosea]